MPRNILFDETVYKHSDANFQTKTLFFLRVSNENGVLRKELTWTTAFALKPLLPLKREHDFNFGSSNPSKSYGASNAFCPSHHNAAFDI